MREWWWAWDGALGWPGGDLLSRALRRSTIGAEGFHGRVRDGIGCSLPRHDHQASQEPHDASRAGPRKAARPPMLRGPVSFEKSVPLSGTGRGLPLQAAGARAGHEAIKPIERLVPVSFMRCRTFTPGLSTWWSSTALMRDLVLRGASRLDAFSGYPVRT
jgi:hypothetical protein